MQMGFYFDQCRCIGCDACVIACKDWHDIPAGPINWRKIVTIERGKFPRVFAAFLSIGCYHCAHPACVPACNSKAITKREDGVVEVDSEQCLGKDRCGACREACPYGIPQFGVEENARMQKCNFCIDRLAENKKPICVAACPTRALDAGPMDELRSRYGDIREAEGFVFSVETVPSIIFKPRREG